MARYTHKLFESFQIKLKEVQFGNSGLKGNVRLFFVFDSTESIKYWFWPLQLCCPPFNKLQQDLLYSKRHLQDLLS